MHSSARPLLLGPHHHHPPPRTPPDTPPRGAPAASLYVRPLSWHLSFVSRCGVSASRRFSTPIFSGDVGARWSPGKTKEMPASLHAPNKSRSQCPTPVSNARRAALKRGRPRSKGVQCASDVTNTSAYCLVHIYTRRSLSSPAHDSPAVPSLMVLLAFQALSSPLPARPSRVLRMSADQSQFPIPRTSPRPHLSSHPEVKNAKKWPWPRAARASSTFFPFPFVRLSFSTFGWKM